jgi:hypothetical protein
VPNYYKTRLNLFLRDKQFIYSQKQMGQYTQLIMKSKLFLLSALLLSSPATIFAQTIVEPWQYHEGNEGIIDRPTNNPQEFINAFAAAKIPTNGWKPLTPANDGTVNFVQGSKITRGKHQVDFTYFRTVVNVSSKVSDFKVTFGEVDDAARVYINRQYVNGSDIIGRKITYKTVDLKDKLRMGNNEIVIVQFDQHPPGNTIKRIGLEMNGAELTAPPKEIKNSPWQIHLGNEAKLVEFETKTLAQRKNAFSQARIPGAADAGWKPAQIRKDGSVLFQAPSQIMKTAGQLDFTYFQTTVNVPKGGVKKFDVQFDLVDDGARIYLFNKKFPSGYYVDAADVIQVQHKLTKVNFAAQAVEGDNRVVIVQFDQSRPGNSLMGLRLQVAG